MKQKERGAKMSLVKITNPNPNDWLGTKYFIDGNEVPRVRSINFHTAVDEIPVFEFEMMDVPDIEMECLAQISVTSQSITDAILVLRHELLQHGEIYHRLVVRTHPSSLPRLSVTENRLEHVCVLHCK